MLEPPHLFIGKVLSTWAEPPQVMVVSSLSGLNYFQFVQTKLSVFCLYVTSYPPPLTPPPVALYNQSQIPLPEENKCVCQVFSVLFHLLSLFIPFVLPYRPLHTRLNENLCSGMKTVVLVFDFPVCVLCAVIHINRAS